MKTRDWISNNFGIGGTYKAFASVYRDIEGNIYSYGPHYPLLFTINGYAFRNVTGYSSSTGRHIQWSRGLDALDVYIPRGTYLCDITLEKIATWMNQEIIDKRAEMDKKKRKNTSVYAWLLRDMGELIQSQSEVLRACGL